MNALAILCVFAGHRLVIPQTPHQFDPIYCDRCGKRFAPS